MKSLAGVQHTYTILWAVLGLFVSLLFTGITQASSYSVLVGGNIQSTNSFITYGAGANIHTNANLKNNGLFNVSGNMEIVGSSFTANSSHPIQVTGNIILPAQFITIPVLSPQCWPNTNYRFEGGASNNSGYIQMYDNNGNLLQTITGGKWSDPSGNRWAYNANLNRWQIEGNNPEVLSGTVFFDTAFKTDVPEFDVGDQTNGGMLVVNGNLQSESALHIQALFSYEHAIVVFGNAEFHGGEDKESEAESHKGWIDDSNNSNIGYNNLITGRVYITGDLESTAPTKINGKLTILGNLDTEGAIRIEYAEGAVKVASSIVAQNFSTPVTLAASQNFSDPTGSGSVNFMVFTKGDSSITPTTSLTDFITRVSALPPTNVVVAIGGADESEAPVMTIYNNFPPSPIKGLIEIYNALVNDYGVNPSDIKITDFISTLPDDMWATISITGTTIGTFLLKRGAQFYSMTTEGLNQYMQNLNTYETSNPEQWQEYLQAMKATWDYYIQTTTNPPQTLQTLSVLNPNYTPSSSTLVCNEDPVIPDDNWCDRYQSPRTDVAGYFDPNLPNYNLPSPNTEVDIADALFMHWDTVFQSYYYANGNKFLPYNPAADPQHEFPTLFGFNYQQYNSSAVTYSGIGNYGTNICGPTGGSMILGYWGLQGYKCVYNHDIKEANDPSSGGYPNNAIDRPYSYWPYLMLEGDLRNLMHPNVWSIPDINLNVSTPGVSPWDFRDAIDQYSMQDAYGKTYSGCFNADWNYDATSVWDSVKNEINSGYPVDVVFPLFYGEPHYVTAFGYYYIRYPNHCAQTCAIGICWTTCYPCYNSTSYWIIVSDDSDTDVDHAIMYSDWLSGYVNVGTEVFLPGGSLWAPIYVSVHPNSLNAGACKNCTAGVYTAGGGGGGGIVCSTSPNAQGGLCEFLMLLSMLLSYGIIRMFKTTK